MAQPTPVKLFFCYAPEDEPLRKELEKHLTLLERQGYLASWSGHTVGAGEDWSAEIERRMAGAQIILLLISADFIASDHLYEVELTRALQRRDEGAYVFGVLLRPADWQHGKLKPLEMLPVADGKVTAVTEWGLHDAAFRSVAERLREKLGVWGYTSFNRITVNPSEAHPRSAPSG